MWLGFLVLLGLVGATPAFADDAVRTGAAAFGDWRTDAPGVRRLIRPADLPAPFATRSTANMSQHEAWTEADVPKAPPGFAVDLFATGLNMPRVIRIAPNGDIFLAETGAGRVRVFHPGKAGAPAAQGEIFADGLQRPYGIAFYPAGSDPKFVYVAWPDSVELETGVSELAEMCPHADIRRPGRCNGLLARPHRFVELAEPLAFGPVGEQRESAA